LTPTLITVPTVVDAGAGFHANPHPRLVVGVELIGFSVKESPFNWLPVFGNTTQLPDAHEVPDVVTFATIVTVTFWSRLIGSRLQTLTLCAPPD
jgi:hypothetical protein